MVLNLFQISSRTNRVNSGFNNRTNIDDYWFNSYAKTNISNVALSETSRSVLSQFYDYLEMQRCTRLVQ